MLLEDSLVHEPCIKSSHFELVVKYIYQRFDLIEKRYEKHILSRRSTPPIDLFAGQSTKMCFFSLLSHLFTEVTKSASMQFERVFTVPLSCHFTVTIVFWLQEVTEVSQVPRPRFFISFSSINLLQRSLFLWTVPI